MISFDNSFVRELPADPDETNRPRQVYNACYSRVAPTPVSAPKLTAYSREVATLLDLSVGPTPYSRAADGLGGVHTGRSIGVVAPNPLSSLSS